MTASKDIDIEPQPIADQLMVKCRNCGWRTQISLYDHDTRETLWAAAHAAADAHECGPE